MLTISQTTPTTNLTLPTSGTDLTSAPAVTTQNRFECRTCPYTYALGKPYFETKKFPREDRKQAAEVMSTASSLEAAMKVDIPACKNEKCDSTRAAVTEHQIRSADEPMTQFFTCVRCFREWREG